MMKAAGTVPPSNVLVLGAGVAGLQAIATAKTTSKMPINVPENKNFKAFMILEFWSVIIFDSES